MDYNEWLLDYYTIQFAPVTASPSFSKYVAIIAGGALVVSFSNIIAGYFSDSLFGEIMPGITDQYTDTIRTPVDTYLSGTISPYLAANNLQAVTNIITQVWDFTNYLVVDVVFAYLNGDLTSDPDYA